MVELSGVMGGGGISLDRSTVRFSTTLSQLFKYNSRRLKKQLDSSVTNITDIQYDVTTIDGQIGTINTQLTTVDYQLNVKNSEFYTYKTATDSAIAQVNTNLNNYISSNDSALIQLYNTLNTNLTSAVTSEVYTYLASTAFADSVYSTITSYLDAYKTANDAVILQLYTDLTSYITSNNESLNAVYSEINDINVALDYYYATKSYVDQQDTIIYTAVSDNYALKSYVDDYDTNTQNVVTSNYALKTYVDTYDSSLSNTVSTNYALQTYVNSQVASANSSVALNYWRSSTLNGLTQRYFGFVLSVTFSNFSSTGSYYTSADVGTLITFSSGVAKCMPIRTETAAHIFVNNTSNSSFDSIATVVKAYPAANVDGGYNVSVDMYDYANTVFNTLLFTDPTTGTSYTYLQLAALSAPFTDNCRYGANGSLRVYLQNGSASTTLSFIIFMCALPFDRSTAGSSLTFANYSSYIVGRDIAFLHYQETNEFVIPFTLPPKTLYTRWNLAYFILATDGSQQLTVRNDNGFKLDFYLLRN